MVALDDGRAALAQLGEPSCNPLFMMPMSVLMMKIPPRVMTNIASRKPAVPSSPPIVPGSSVRRRPNRRSVGKSRSWSLAIPVSQTIRATATMSSAEMTNSPTMRAIVPRPMNSSKR